MRIEFVPMTHSSSGGPVRGKMKDHTAQGHSDIISDSVVLRGPGDTKKIDESYTVENGVIGKIQTDRYLVHHRFYAWVEDSVNNGGPGVHGTGYLGRYRLKVDLNEPDPFKDEEEGDKKLDYVFLEEEHRREALNFLRQKLVEWRVSTIINIDDERQNRKEKNFLYQDNDWPNIIIHRFPTEDYTPIDKKHLQKILEIVKNAREENESVVIHCGAGNGRTGTALIASLLQFQPHLSPEKMERETKSEESIVIVKTYKFIETLRQGGRIKGAEYPIFLMRQVETLNDVTEDLLRQEKVEF